MLIKYLGQSEDSNVTRNMIILKQRPKLLRPFTVRQAKMTIL